MGILPPAHFAMWREAGYGHEEAPTRIAGERRPSRLIVTLLPSGITTTWSVDELRSQGRAASAK